MKGVMLSTDLNNPETIPYFLWDDPITVGELKHHLKQGTQAESNRLLAKILREAKDSDVWIFTTPIEVTQRWGAIAHMLGRRRKFWEFILRHWKKAGLLVE